MIYTVTFSPAIDYVMNLDNFNIGDINRSISESFLPGGKGINVSIVLSNLGAKTVATGFLGGVVGEYIKSELNKLNITSDFIDVDGITRINVKIRSNEETAINGQGPHISDEDVEKLINKLQNIKENDFLVISGAISKTLPSDTYEKILSRLKNKNIKIVVDCTKDTLLKTLSYNPFMIKPNKEELEEVLNCKINDDIELERQVTKLIELGAENVIVSLGKDGAFIKGKNIQALKIKAPKGKVVNTVGAGDSLVAGFLYEYERTGNLIDALKVGVATGSASAYSENLATKEEVLNLLSKM